jgi:hypothetical protein
VTFHEKTGVLNLRVTATPSTRGAPLPMAQRLELSKPLLDQVFQQHRRKDYLLTVGEYPELGSRAATAAACSGKWNAKTGQPRTGKAAAAFKELLSDSRLYPEIETFFDSFGYRATVNSVEAVMLCRWRDIKPATLDSGCHPSLRPQSLVPCGASITLRLDAKETTP